METSIRKYSIVKQDSFNLTAEFNVAIEKKEKAYKKLINKKFKSHKRETFEKLIDFKKVSKVSIGQICYMPSPNASINIFIAQKEYESQNEYTVLEINDKSINENYLLWFLNHKEVKEYLLCFSVGAIFTYISKQSFNLIEIPFPKTKLKYSINEINLESKESAFRKLLNQYYQEYIDNFNKGHYMTASILAGAISETFLHNYLIEIGINQKLFENKTLGGLIDLVEVYLHEREILDFPLNHFKEIQGLRNTAVHPKLAKDKIEREEEFGINNFDCFNHIIKYFGL